MRLSSLASAVVMLAATATADTYQLPRAHGQMPVNAAVECVAPEGDATGCIVSHHCATASDWAYGIAPADFARTLPEIAVGAVRLTPTATSASNLCALHVEGDANVTAFRSHRRRVDDEWSELSRESVAIHRAGSLVSVPLAAGAGVGVLPHVVELLGVEDAGALVAFLCSDLVEGTRDWRRCLTENEHVAYAFAYFKRDDYSVCLVDALFPYFRESFSEAYRGEQEFLKHVLSGLTHQIWQSPVEAWRLGRHYRNAIAHCDDLRPAVGDLP